MTAADHLAYLAKYLRDTPQPEHTDAILKILAAAMHDMIRTSPAKEADRFKTIADLMCAS